jgi:putative transposase
VYCCAILDCFSRMIVARTFSTTADTALVNNAVNMAVADRNRSGTTILHADHGTQFTSWSFGENMRLWGLLGSFATVGDCMTTPPWSHSGPACRSSYSTPASGQPPTSWPPRSPITSTTSNAVTATSVTSGPTEYETLWTSTNSIPQLA